MSDKDGARKGAGPYSRNFLTGAGPQGGAMAKYHISPAAQAAQWPKVTKRIDKDEGRKGFKGVGIDGKQQQGGLPKFRNKKDWA